MEQEEELEVFEVGDTVGWIRPWDGAHFEGVIVALRGEFVKVEISTIKGKKMVVEASLLFMVEKGDQNGK
jgi:hypothetical protein